ncbi:hypothetical protein PV327_006382 [Microctonus hyperodae]|uniref:Ribosomal RNA-processing protein 43 n=1 Tax=Microctonus hyperodae TaxID=165561 RepID=A0AA39F471_MICHY|nr:hypothetical protein PV327_006382 [Microctonus hyperodae]
MATLYKTIYPTKYLGDYLSQNIRPDGREFMSFRPVSLNVSSISQADSSSIIKIGNTAVTCGIKAELAAPKGESPDCGFVIPNVGLSPLCSPKFRPGPPSVQAQVITKLIDDILTNSQVIDLHDLCICKDKLVWVLYCDLECIDCDGSLIDACVGALMAALTTLRLPEVNYNSEAKTTVVHPNNKISIPLRCLLASTTFAVFNDDILLVDPTEHEETESLTQFTIVIGNGEICTVHKPGGIPISQDLLLKSLTKAIAHSDKMQLLINTAVIEK